jgi:membrane protein implicated in regulation of membrane protease activity
MGRSEASSQDASTLTKIPRRSIRGFIIYSIIEIAVIGLVAFLIIFLFLPNFFIPATIGVVAGLIIFTLVRFRLYSSTANIPIEETLIGKTAIAVEDFSKNRSGRWEGLTRLQGETWRAVAEGRVAEGDSLLIVGVKGLRLLVRLTQEEH